MKPITRRRFIVHVKVYSMLDGSKWEPKPDSEPPAGLDWDAWLGPAPEVSEFQCIPYDYGDFAMTRESGNATSYLQVSRRGSLWQPVAALADLGDPGRNLRYQDLDVSRSSRLWLAGRGRGREGDRPGQGPLAGRVNLPILP